MDIKNGFGLLELIERPAFIVQDGIITQVNQAASRCLLTPGTAAADILKQNTQAYEAFSGGTACFAVSLSGVTYSAAVKRMEGYDVFLLEKPDAVLQALELAAQQLRGPLNDTLIAVDRLNGSNLADSACYIHRSLNRMQRILGNMADVGWYQRSTGAHKEETNLTYFFDELMEKLQALTEAAGRKLCYTGPMQIAVSAVDRVMLERAVSNLVSNAIKFSPKGSTVDACVSVSGDMLQFSVLDQGERENIPDPANLFSLYLRPPIVEDGRRGMGLGLPLAAAAAAAHGGTLLIDHPRQSGTRVTMTLLLTPAEGTDVRMPVSLPASDYAGGRDHGLLELSDVLPAAAYKDL